MKPSGTTPPYERPGCISLTLAWTFLLAGSTFLCVTLLGSTGDSRLALGVGLVGAIVFTILLIRSEIKLID